MIYQDVFSCVPSDLIHSRYNHIFRYLCSNFPAKTLIADDVKHMQSCFPTKHQHLEGETRTYNHWFRNHSWETGDLSEWKCQTHGPDGETAINQRSSCFFPFGLYVQWGSETRLQWRWVLRIISGVPLGSIHSFCYFSKFKGCTFVTLTTSKCCTPLNEAAGIACKGIKHLSQKEEENMRLLKGLVVGQK